MRKIILTIAITIAVPAILCAQNTEQTAKEQISQILQKENEFLYADQTCATAEQALQKARDILNREIEAYLKQDSSDIEVVKGTITDKVVAITVSRGDKYRAFVYIDKNGLGTFNENLSPKAQKQEQPQTNTTQSNPKPAENVAELNGTHTVTPEPVITTKAQESRNYNKNETSEIILSMTKKNQLYDYITMLKEDGDGAEWYSQPYSSSDLNKMYLVLYRRNGEVEVILTPANDIGERTNLATGALDSRANHPGTSVNGFILNN